MKDRITASLRLFRDVPLALAYTIIWVVVLWAAKYPMDERVSVAIIAYVLLFLAREVMSVLTRALLRSLRDYGLRAAARAGIDVSGAAQGDSSTGGKAVATLFLLSLIATILGFSLVPTTYIAPLFGLSPLAPYFAAIGWVILAAGIIALTLFFALSFILFKAAGSLSESNSLNARISHIRQSELLVRRLNAQPASS